jgi:hypothetical protein
LESVWRWARNAAPWYRWFCATFYYLLAAVGLAISVPAALSASQLVKSFLFKTQPNDPGTVALAGVVLLYKRRNSRWPCAGKASLPN